jgi:NADH:ubiquinone oxidoreductase subunit 4 (subunit M)
LAALGLIASMIYSLVILQKIFHGRERSELKITDFSIREKMIMGGLIIVIFWIGLFPQTIFDTVKPPVSILKSQTVFLHKQGSHQAIDLNNKTTYITGSNTIKTFPDYTFHYAQITKKAK